MGDPRNLSFATTFNHPKIIINEPRQVTVPVSGIVSDTLFTITTGLQRLPFPPRLYVEYGGVMSPSNATGLDIQFFASFNALNSLVVRSYSLEPSPVDLTVYVRVYIDARPS